MPTSGVAPTTVTVNVVDGNGAGGVCGSCDAGWFDVVCAAARSGSSVTSATTLQATGVIRDPILRDIPHRLILFTVSVATPVASPIDADRV